MTKSKGLKKFIAKKRVSPSNRYDSSKPSHIKPSAEKKRKMSVPKRPSSSNTSKVNQSMKKKKLEIDTYDSAINLIIPQTLLTQKATDFRHLSPHSKPVLKATSFLKKEEQKLKKSKRPLHTHSHLQSPANT